MEEYKSKQAQVNQPAEMIYSTLSDFNNFTPILQDKVEGWQATADTCAFKVKGFEVKLRITDREPGSHIKIEGEEGSPFDFAFWLQMKEVGENDTRIRLVLHVKLNMMMKMMVGGKIQSTLDEVVQQMADTFNNAPGAVVDPHDFYTWPKNDLPS